MDLDALPHLPVPPAELVKHIAERPETPLAELVEPYRQYEAYLRQAFAQQPDLEILKDPYVNVLPLFTADTSDIKIRARDLDNESQEEKAKYIMPLPKDLRRPGGSPATVESLKEFQRNFSVFSESSLGGLDWSNVVASGSAVVNCLLPVPEQYSGSNRGLREFYHEKFCPASDIDLFLYGLTEEEAIEKIKAIETQIADSLLTEITTVRTKNAITICSQYPTRHIQIVLRIYKSVSEIVTGFDIDCSGAAYDGEQVPSYENRLSKYSHRGFEIYWPDLDRSRVDPTIFERSFQKTLGLAKLLVLEQLPTPSSRDSYLDKRRLERGRPVIDRFYRNLRSIKGNIKEEYEDEVADWVIEEGVSNYHTFAIPYGPKFHAKKIEKTCYTKDLLLNAEWNQPEDRKVYLHRHPAFFGRFEDVMHDCCGSCPVPTTEDEIKIAEEEQKIYVYGKISFLQDNPGRQEIGSFNPLTENDWTEMAYVGNTARLCQAIVDEDAEHVEDWLSQEGADPNTRDYTGRTPLHLAVTCSTPEVVRLLVNASARLVSRIADGRTALHLAAARGNVEIVKILMDRSNSNEAEFEEKKDQQQQAKLAARGQEAELDEDKMDVDEDSETPEDEDGELVEDPDSEDEGGNQSMATGSFVKVGSKKEAPQPGETVPEDNEEEPDFYDVNIIAWDTPCSALQMAIMAGHDEVVKSLCQDYGADILLPVKFHNQQKKPYAAVLTLALALALPVEKAKSMVTTILSLGASSAQADLNGVTAFDCCVKNNAESVLDTLLEQDKTGVQSAINHTNFAVQSISRTPLQEAIKTGNLSLVLKLLENGAVPTVKFDSWLKAAKQSPIENRLRGFEDNESLFNSMVEHPLVLALKSANPAIALELIDRGADLDVLTTTTHSSLGNRWYGGNWTGQSALDLAQDQLRKLREYKGENGRVSKPVLPEGINTYLDTFKQGTYQHYVVSNHIDLARKHNACQMKLYERDQEFLANDPGAPKKMAAIKNDAAVMEKVVQKMLDKGAKKFSELYPYRDNPQTEAFTDPDEVAPYSYVFSFNMVIDATEARLPAYIELFEAAWSGDLEKIKLLTLTSWDDAKEEAPLSILVCDNQDNNPFSLAFSRGHHDVAKAILEIAAAQYSPREKPKTRYLMGAARDEDSDDDSEVGEGLEMEIYSEIIDDRFTIEDIGKVSMQVTSHHKPQQFGTWQYSAIANNGKMHDPATALHHVIFNNDLKGLKFLLDMWEHFGSQKLDPADTVSGFYSFPSAEFDYAVRLGRTELLVEIIRRTGAGLPLEHLVKDSGVELKETSGYYQGLSVYGKKRKDWAAAGRETAYKPETGTTTPPLITAIRAGCIESVEWFLSDTPLRHYLHFAKSEAAQADERIQHLTQAAGGIDGTITKWLNDYDEEDIICSAVNAPASKKSNEVASYLIKSCPSLVNTITTRSGLRTKAINVGLLKACEIGRVDIAKSLIEAGADLTAKDVNWNNLLHQALGHCPTAEQLKTLLDILDHDAVVHMLKERNNLGDEGRTPLHAWLFRLCQAFPYQREEGVYLEVFNLLLSISPESNKRVLEMLDGAGDTPLHSLVSATNSDYSTISAMIRGVLDVDQGLLFRENAVGRTPAEVAHDRFIANRVAPPPQYQWYSADNGDKPKQVARPTSDYLDQTDKPREHEDASSQARIWNLCLSYLGQDSTSQQGSAKRRLVGLHEANDVAKRLGEKFMSARYRFSLKAKSSEDGSEAGEAGEAGEVEGRRGKRARRRQLGAYMEPLTDRWKLVKEEGDRDTEEDEREEASVAQRSYDRYFAAGLDPLKVSGTRGYFQRQQQSRY
ncbi:hypothetical protein B0T17DRAFT_509862 [Bombardia bombarda]|uniref:Ankyrin repeat protein n=1 Tax=Bombardia bombarda TaxID=252184 RepID=A0AA39WMX8_9PEZI|nr:hypothetical protein B0T17DRAFT_509862 [Bombardia bombarda]